jgi:hypothetical protein
MRLNTKARNRQILAPIHARLTSGIYAAIRYCRKTNDIAGLQHDIENSIEHVLNNHENCRNYFCDALKVRNNSKTYKKLKECLGYDQLLIKLKSLKKNAEAFLKQFNTNKSERLFSRINKANMGKRSHFAGRGSFERRAKMCAIQDSEGYQWHIGAMTQYNIRVSEVTQLFTRKREREISNLRAHRIKNPSRKKQSRSNRNMFYGNVQPEISPEQIQQNVRFKLEQLKISPDAIDSIEKSTREVDNNVRLRRQEDRLHCMFMSPILELQGDVEKTENLVCRIRSSKINHNAILSTDKSIAAKLLVETQVGVVRSTGLWIDSATGYFCCQPHGVIDNVKALVEFCDKVTNANFVTQNVTNDGITTKKIGPRMNSALYHKIQIQLHITGYQACYVVFQLNHKHQIARIKVNPLYWQIHKDAFTSFFEEQLIPESLTNTLLHKKSLNKIIQNRHLGLLMKKKIIRTKPRQRKCEIVI